MVLYVNAVDVTKRITEEQLRELTNNLGLFIETYWKNIYINDEKKLAAFKKLQQIHVYLVTKQYEQLFDDPRIIMTDFEMDKYD